MPAAPIFLIAHPRSGTHALTSKISQRSEVFVFGEVFNPSPDSEVYPANYYHFLRATMDTPLASPKNSETRFNAYLGYLQSRARNLRFLVDAKYDTLHLFDGEMREISAPPAIITYLSKRNVQIVHLKRNVLHIYFSLMNAAATSQWQVLKGEQSRSPKLIIDTEHMMSFVMRKMLEQQQVTRIVRSTNVHIEVWYEHLFGRGGAGAFQHLSAFLGLENLADEESAYMKQITQPYEQLIQNWSDVVAALARSPYVQLLDDASASDR